jgi:hypothetical protein
MLRLLGYAAEEEVQFAAQLRLAFYRCPELDETALSSEVLVNTVSWGCDSYSMTNLRHRLTPLDSGLSGA